jgi:SAM-dependent methyltransferase
MFRKGLSMFRKVLFNEGIFPCLECIVRQTGTRFLGMSPAGFPRINLALFRITDALYDSLHKVDTGGVIDLPEMEGKGKNYVGTPPRAWKLMLNHLPIDPSLFTYIDFGCGKGRTLLLASKMGFKRIIGVDISQQLLNVARQNMERKNVDGELVCGDVREFDFPNEPLVTFMYNPFFPDVMLRLAENLRDSVRSHPREVYVVYYSAAFRDVWRSLDFSVFRETDYTYPNYAIYHANSFDAIPGRSPLLAQLQG